MHADMPETPPMKVKGCVVEEIVRSCETTDMWECSTDFETSMENITFHGSEYARGTTPFGTRRP